MTEYHNPKNGPDNEPPAWMFFVLWPVAIVWAVCVVAVGIVMWARKK